MKKFNRMGSFTKKFYHLIYIGLLLATSITSAQDLTRNNWYFGNAVHGIRFNRGTDVAEPVTNQATPFAAGLGGSAVATDPSNANLLFYSDGATIYDGCHLPMLNGGGLTGNNAANQPVAISPVPGQPGKYFVFTNSASFTTGGTISRSVVDMNLFGSAVFPSPALGDVENPKNVAVPSLVNRSEGMIVVPHANGLDFWLITHQVTTQNYSATLIDAASYTSGTFNTITTSGAGLPITVANFSYHAGLGKLAVSPQGPNVDAHILDFNNTTGLFSFDRYILNSGRASTANDFIYDIEWSASGRFLYLSRHGEAGINADVLQYDYANTTSSFLSVISPSVFRSYGLQMAPDSVIYHLYQATSGGAFLLGALTNTDTLAAGVNYNPMAFGNINYNGKQFPGFAPRTDVTITLSFTSIGTCQNTPITFFPMVNPGADSLQWNFGDGMGASAWSPMHTYVQAQPFNVTLTAFYQGQTQTVSQAVNVSQFDLQLQLVQDTTACQSEFPPPRGSASPQQFSVTVTATGGTPTSYIWSNGDTGPILTPDSAGYYYVVVTDVSGCSAYAGVNVREYGLQDQRANIWYFGDRAGIDFNEAPPVPLDNSAMNTPEGCAIICDRNGEAIFYTDGDKVYNKDDIEIATGIGGSPLSAQSAIIVPAPDDETLYYIFTTQAVDGTTNYELQYSLFDLKQNGGLGAVVQQNVVLYAMATERIAANGSWIVSHEYGNNTFRAYPITPDGIGSPVFSGIGSDHAFCAPGSGEGYMKLGPRNNLAVALSSPGISNKVELFQLNDSTGAIENFRPIDLNEPNGQVYGIEFSPGGNKVFASVKGSPSPSKIYEYFLDSLERPFFVQQVQQPVEIGALQLAPDGQIYFAINGSGTLGAVIANDDTTQLSAFNLNAFTLAAGTTSGLGLPNFIQQISNATGGPGFTFAGLCLGQPTEFVGTPTDAIDMFQWFFGDGAGDTQAAPSHTYAAANTYTVSMNLTNRCGLDTTVVQPVTIVPSPAMPTLLPAETLCMGPITLDANSGNTPGLTYLWSSGDVTQTVVLNNPGVISVTNTDSNGCEATAQSIVVDSRPLLDLGADLTICEDNAIQALDAQNPGANYAWTIDGVLSSTTQLQSVDVTTPGLFTYAVTVTDPVTSCLTQDTIALTVNVSPQFTITGMDPSACNTADGSITLDILTSIPAGGPYSYFLSGPNGFNQVGIDEFAPSTIGPVGGQVAGTFSAVVQDQISGCSISSSFGLNNNSFTAAAASLPPNCDPVMVEVTTDATLFPLQVTATDNNTGAIFGPFTGIATAVFTIPVGLAQGTYTIEVQDNTGCIQTISNFDVTPGTPVAIGLSSDVCSSPATITATGGDTYSWIGPGLGIPVTGATLQIPAGQSGSLTYMVTASAAGQCDNTQSITVLVDPITPAFTQSDPCATSVLLTATPSGNYTYRWYRNGAATPAVFGRQISLPQTEDGASYRVEVVSAANGCATSSPSQVVEISGNLTASLTATPACNDDSPFQLSSSTNGIGVTYQWFRNNAAIAGASGPTITDTLAGIYRVEISRGSCMTSAQVQVIKAPIPFGDLPNRVVICNDPDNIDPLTSEVDLDPGSFNQYRWFRDDVSLTYTNQVYTATSEGIYKVEMTNSFGCVNSDETVVDNECIPKIEAPDAFRPSSNLSENQNFYVFSFFITDEFQIFIYNRWGELVFTSNDRNFLWNGGYNNDSSQPVISGAYAYVIKYVSAFRPDLGIQEQRGGVMVVR